MQSWKCKTNKNISLSSFKIEYLYYKIDKQQYYENSLVGILQNNEKKFKL